MPLTVAQLATNEANLALEIEGDTINIVYFPNKLSTKMLDRLTSLDGINQALGELIKSWDLMADEHTVYPLDAESLSDLGIGLVKAVASGIVNDIRPN